MADTIDSQKLSIDSVIKGTCGQTADILYAEFIDTSAIENCINNLTETFDVNSEVNNTNELISNITGNLEKTNSNRFSTGSSAATNINNLNDISTNLTTLIDGVNNIDFEAIKSIAQQYNEKLEELKKDTRIKLLRDAADVWNKAKNIKSETTVYYPSDWPPMNVTAIFDSSVVYTEFEYVGVSQQAGTFTAAVLEYKQKDYKIIKYWDGLKNVHWFKDPGFDEVEAMFDEVGCPLPYEPSAIVDPVDGTYSSSY